MHSICIYTNTYICIHKKTHIYVYIHFFFVLSGLNCDFRDKIQYTMVVIQVCNRNLSLKKRGILGFGFEKL